MASKQRTKCSKLGAKRLSVQPEEARDHFPFKEIEQLQVNQPLQAFPQAVVARSPEEKSRKGVTGRQQEKLKNGFGDETSPPPSSTIKQGDGMRQSLQLNSLQHALLGTGKEALKVMEQAVTEIGSELGTAMGRFGRDLDRWGNRLETKVEELLPGWVPPTSAFERALDRRWDDRIHDDTASNFISSAADNGLALTSVPSTGSSGWDDWGWPDTSCNILQPRQSESASDSTGCGLPGPLQELPADPQQSSKGSGQGNVSNLPKNSELTGRLQLQPAGVVQGEGHSDNLDIAELPQLPYQAYRQLELTLMHLLEKHERLREENNRLAAENQSLQEMMDLLAGQDDCEEDSVTGVESEACIPSASCHEACIPSTSCHAEECLERAAGQRGDLLESAGQNLARSCLQYSPDREASNTTSDRESEGATGCAANEVHLEEP